MRHLTFLLCAGVIALAGTRAASMAQSSSSTPPPPPPPADALKINAALTYLRGDFGLAEDTEVFAAPVGLVYETTAWRFRATLPVLRVSGPAAVVGDGGAAGTPVRPSSDTQTGLGDLSASVTRKLGAVLGDAHLDLTARVGLPTGDEDKGFSTGEADVYLQADVFRTIGRFTPFAQLGYRFAGSNTRYPLEDGPYAGVGLAHRTTDTTTVGASLSWRSAIVDNADDAVELIAFLSRQFTDRWDAQFYALTGFTDASPDLGIGTQVNYKF